MPGRKHDWFDCEVPPAFEAYGETWTCPDCGLVWYATESGWRNREHGTVRDADQTKAKHREEAEVADNEATETTGIRPGRRPRGKQPQ